MNKDTMDDSSPSGALTVGQLREIIRGEIRTAMGQTGHGEGNLLTPEELADRFKVPVSWVYEQSRQGNIPTHRIGRYIRFNFLEVIASQEKKN